MLLILMKEIEVYKMKSISWTSEIKLLYRVCLDCAGNYPVVVSGGMSTFQVILSRGKCCLLFDTMSVISGNTTESPVIVDLIQVGVLDSDVEVNGQLWVSISDDKLVITDLEMNDGSVVVDFVGGRRVFWDRLNSHLLVVDSRGKVYDMSWSNGLVGVATRPEKGVRPSTRACVCDFDVNLVDFRGNVLVTVVDGELVVYRGEEKSLYYPISRLVNKFEVERKSGVVVYEGEEIFGVCIVGKSKIGIVLKKDDKERVKFVDILD